MKAKQLQRQPKKICESGEKLKEEDKKYLRKLNFAYHSDEVVNKTIEQMLANIQLRVQETI